MIEDYFFTKNTKWILWGALALILALLIFHAGVEVGQQQPRHSHASFNGLPPQPGMLSGIMPQQDFVADGHGAVGTVATVTLPTFILTSRGGLDEEIYAGTSTVVTGGASADTSALKSGETVIVIGDPEDTDDGYLDARIIHILPSSAPAPAQ